MLMIGSMFSAKLQAKIDFLKKKSLPIALGSIKFNSPLLLAPMASICNAPFRLLMEDLGAGGTVSELISCHGINYGNRRTLDMLKIDPREKVTGIQLFGEEPEAMARAAETAMDYKPQFIDINMGCPVKKVVTKGGGSALLKDPKSLAPYLREIKKAIPIPLTIKIRMGWDAEGINADEIVKVANDEGIEWVAIHGRTRAQQYTGLANWDYIEALAENSPLPIIGNGDLHHHETVYERLNSTKCEALMIARGALRNPFIFLESLAPNQIEFTGEDYWEIIQKLYQYTTESFEDERTQLIQIRKLIVWFAAGFPNTSKFRGILFQTKTIEESMRYSEDYFLGLGNSQKSINYSERFMTSGHG